MATTYPNPVDAKDDVNTGKPIIKSPSGKYTYSQDTADLQKELNKKGANLVVDGFYGPLTQAAEKKYKDIPAPTVATSDKANNAYKNAQDAANNYQYTPPKAKDTLAADVADIEDKQQTAYDAYLKKIKSIDKGNLSPEEQASLDATETIFNSNREAQIRANKNFTAGITELGIRAGRQRYAGEIEQGNIKASIDQGITKLQELDAKQKSTVAEMRMAFKEKNYKQAVDVYNAYIDILNQKTKNLFDLHDLALKDQKYYDDLENESKTSNQKDYEYYKSLGGTMSFYDWTNAKTGSTEANPSGSKSTTKTAATPAGSTIITKEVADQYKLPKALVGLTDTQFKGQLASDVPPTWFREYMENTLSMSLTPEALISYWKKYKSDPAVVEYLAFDESTKKKSSSSKSSSGFDKSGLPAPITD